MKYMGGLNLNMITDLSVFKSSEAIKKYGEKSPLQIIQDRIVLESRRLLRYSDKTIKDIFLYRALLTGKRVNNKALHK